VTVRSQPAWAADAVISADEERLRQLGYKQELRRKLSGFSNFAVSFSIISILAGCLTSFSVAMAFGGPVAITMGWLVVGGMVTLVALAMAEVCSAYPTAGGLYWWAFALARGNKAAWAWFVGWFNFLGEIAVTAAIDYGAAITTVAFLNLTLGVEATRTITFAIFVAIIVTHGFLNAFGVSLVRILSDFSAWWHLAGVGVIVAILIVVPDNHKPLTEVFLETKNATGVSGTGGLIYALLIGLLMAQYTFTGYDASAHVAEETRDAARSAPRGIVMSVVVSLVAGFFLLFAVTWAIQDYDGAASTTIGFPIAFPPAQIFIDAAGPTLGKFMLFIALIAQYFCGMASVTANSRMAYAFSRDGALPGSRLWKQVNPHTGTPTNSIWLCVLCSILLVVPALWSTVAYVAATSIAVIGLYVAYVTPVLLRRINPAFEPGPWNLGPWSAAVGWTAILWVAFITVLFVLPPVFPVTWANFNYTIVAVGIVIGGAGIWWVLGARRWFVGPQSTVVASRRSAAVARHRA
jgi:amino acid permease (GABA permease)